MMHHGLVQNPDLAQPRKLLSSHQTPEGDVYTPNSPSLVPRPYAFVACSTKFAQRAWACSSRDACCSLCHDPSTKINDVIDELVDCLPLKEAPRDHSNGLRANLLKC